MSLEQALAVVKAAGYRVSKPKTKVVHNGLNAVGKPYSPQYDPNYRMRRARTNIARLHAPYGPRMRLTSWNV